MDHHGSSDERAQFHSMEEGTQEDWAIIARDYVGFAAGLPDRVLAHLKLLDGDFGGFPIDRLTHSLQTATRAYRDGRGESYVVMALLHDIGQLLDDAGAAAEHYTVDARHEKRGADLLAHWFGPAVTEPVRLHVAAKRYLCAVDPAYQAGLSAASILSLVLQGGPMDIEEQARFCAQPHAADAVTLRRWDDAAKDPHCAVPPLDSWRPLLASLLRVSVQP